MRVSNLNDSKLRLTIISKKETNSWCQEFMRIIFVRLKKRCVRVSSISRGHTDRLGQSADVGLQLAIKGGRTWKQLLMEALVNTVIIESNY